MLRLARAGSPLEIGIISCALAAIFAQSGFSGLSGASWPAVLFIWLFVVIARAAFAPVRHADCLALRLGEPHEALVPIFEH